ncbi:MAG TPA: bifunctional 2-polyprenyl-6-hydroxyphenol methylase/3-demethylubiquinol 3-O-methyltransferase UbiG [Candidatus Azoamicus sp.]
MNKKNVFDIISKDWWKKEKICQPLHIINNIRFNYIKSKTKIKNANILDLGCGGGILTEKLAKHGANIIALDKSKELIKIAKSRKNINSIKIKYLNMDIIDFLKTCKIKFDTIICMELLEHIENKIKIIKLLKNAIKKNGIIILSSLNKNTLTYIKIILLAEFILNKLPKNTHNFKNLVKINEINKYKKKLKITDIKEINYDPIFKYSKITKLPEINYIITIKKC